MYEIEYGTDGTNFTTVDTGSGDTYYNLTGLQHNTTYHIRVVAVNYIQVTPNIPPIRGNESNTLAVTLVPQPPLTPITTPTTTDMPSPGTTGGITGTYVCPVKQYGHHYSGMMWEIVKYFLFRDSRCHFDSKCRLTLAKVFTDSRCLERLQATEGGPGHVLMGTACDNLPCGRGSFCLFRWGDL